MKDMKNKPNDDIKTLATGMGIALSVEEEEYESRGWVGQAKGLLQVLWERGWINETTKVGKHYTMTCHVWSFGPPQLPK